MNLEWKYRKRRARTTKRILMPRVWTAEGHGCCEWVAGTSFDKLSMYIVMGDTAGAHDQAAYGSDRTVRNTVFSDSITEVFVSASKSGPATDRVRILAAWIGDNP